MKLDSLLSSSHRKDSFLIPKEMMITGTIQTDAPGQIAGIIKGDVLTKSRIIILKEGIINGDVTADELLVYGKINGHVKSCIRQKTLLLVALTVFICTIVKESMKRIDTSSKVSSIHRFLVSKDKSFVF